MDYISLPITDAPYQVMYLSVSPDDQSFFGRWFKAQTGISPKAYRNSK